MTGPPTVHTASRDGTVRKLAPDGTELWVDDGHDDYVIGVAVHDGDACTASLDGTVRKLGPDGAERWRYGGHRDGVYKVAVDGEGNVYTAGSDGRTAKLAPDGTERWVASHRGVLEDVAVGPDRVYAVTGRRLHALSLDGDRLRESDRHGDRLDGVAADREGVAYATGTGGAVRAVDRTGRRRWRYDDHDREVYNAAVREGRVVTASRDGTVRVLGPDGTERRRYDHPGAVYEVALDGEGTVYTAGSDAARKLRPDGTEVWAHDDHADNVYDVAVDDPRRYRWRGRRAAGDGTDGDSRSRLGGLLRSLPFVD